MRTVHLLFLLFAALSACGRLSVERGFEFQEGTVYYDVQPPNHLLLLSARGDMELSVGTLQLMAIGNIAVEEASVRFAQQIGIKLESLTLLVTLQVDRTPDGISEVCVHYGSGAVLDHVCWPLIVTDDPTTVQGSVNFSEGTGE